MDVKIVGSIGTEKLASLSQAALPGLFHESTKASEVAMLATKKAGKALNPQSNVMREAAMAKDKALALFMLG